MDREFVMTESEALNYDELIASNTRKLTRMVEICPVFNRHAIRSQTLCDAYSTRFRTC